MFYCKDCDYRSRQTFLGTGLLGPHANCPRCNNPAPDKRTKRDKVDSMLRSPYRMIHWILGGKLYHCVFCRLQFYDVRGLRAPETVATAAQSSAHSKPSKARMAS